MIKMKKTLKYIAVLSMTVLLSSCGNEWLDLQPDNSFSSTQKLTTKNLVDMQIGMYDAIQSNTDYYGAKMIYDGEIRGDDFQYKVEGSSKGESSYSYTYSLENAVGCWAQAYYLIKTANAIIESQVSDATSANETTINDIKGQAYFMKALGHFDVLRNYGEFYDINSKWGIPYMDKFVPGDQLATNKPARSTVKQVYDKIVEDLKEAIRLMPEGKAPVGFAGQSAAKALLCRVYLYMGENKSCLDLANEIITNNSYTLWKNNEYLSAWSKLGNSETMFEIVSNTDDNNGTEGIAALMYPQSGNLGYGAIVATLQYANLFQEGDVRKGLFIEDKDAKEKDVWLGKKIFMHKYPGVVKSPSGEGFNNLTASIPLFRLSEVYLNGAEAAQKLNNSQADELLTAIVQRANPAAPAVSGANLERVLLERRKELGGEGHRFYDALRNEKAMYRDDVKNYMVEVNASGVTIELPAGIQGENEKLHPVLNSAYMTIDRNSRKIIYPIPARELRIINTEKEILQQYYKW